MASTEAFESETYMKYFYLPKETVWSYTLPGTFEIATNRACSKSYISVLSEAERADVKEDIKAIVEHGQGKVWIDERRNIFEYPYQAISITRIAMAQDSKVATC
jgi:hypothetical protein